MIRHSIILLTFIAFFSSSQAVQTDRLRVERHSKTHGILWSEKKIERYFEQQLPLVTSLGYLAYHHGSGSREKWEHLLDRFQNIGQERDLLKQGIAIRGERLPRDIRAALKNLRQSMLDVTGEIYGEATKELLIEYLSLHK